MHASILFVDDEPNILESLKRNLRQEPYHLFFANSGKQALDLLAQENIDIVVSDECMPRMKGSELLSIVQDRYPDTARVILTGYANLNSAIRAINDGQIHYYLTKPCNTEDLKKILEEIRKRKDTEKKLQSLSAKVTSIAKWEWDLQSKQLSWNQNAENLFGFYPTADCRHYTELFYHVPVTDQGPLISAIESCLEKSQSRSIEHRVALPGGATRWVEQLLDVVHNSEQKPIKLIAVGRDITEEKNRQAETIKLARKQKQIIEETVNSLSIMSEKRDPYTAGHQRRVTELAAALARKMQLDDSRIEGLQIAAKLHDIGKVYIPMEFLNKPCRLAPPEMEVIKMHSRMGFDILKDIPFEWSIAEIVLQHHEKLDGSGYPRGLCYDDLFIESRILTVADVFEAMSSHRPYRPSLGQKAALEEVCRYQGTHFDYEVVKCLVSLIEDQHFTYSP